MDELKFGDLIGIDEHGNKYYQNKMYFLGDCYLFLIHPFIYSLVLMSMETYALCLKKNCKIFLSQVREMSTNFDNFLHIDSPKDRFMWDALIFHLT